MRSNIRKFTIFIIIAILFIIYMHVMPAYSNSEYGLLAKVFYAPLGAGIIQAPYYATSLGTVTSQAENNKEVETYSGAKYTLGIFFEYMQCEFSYFKSSIENQIIEDSETDLAVQVNGDAVLFDIKVGKRFSFAGDTSYSLLYASGRRMDLLLNISSTNVRGYGYHIGYYGYKSLGFKSDIEFAFNYDLYIGRYKRVSYSSDINIEQEKDRSIIAGFSFGFGVQYEPYNITCLLKYSTELNQIVNKGVYFGESVELGVSTAASYIGIELIYILPSFKYNLRDD